MKAGMDWIWATHYIFLVPNIEEKQLSKACPQDQDDPGLNSCSAKS